MVEDLLPCKSSFLLLDSAKEMLFSSFVVRFHLVGLHFETYKIEENSLPCKVSFRLYCYLLEYQFFSLPRKELLDRGKVLLLLQSYTG